MDRDKYKKYLRMLGEELQKQEVTGEILVADDVVVMLDVRNPEESDDMNAYFPKNGVTIRQAIIAIANRENLPHNWLENTVSELLHTSSCAGWLEYPGLRIYTPVLEHALAMLVATSIPDDLQDIESIKRLTTKLQITTTRALQASVIKYLSKQLVTSEMRTTIKSVCKRTKKNYEGGKL